MFDPPNPRVHCVVLDWNKTALSSSSSCGPEPVSGWTSDRLDGDVLAHVGLD